MDKRNTRRGGFYWKDSRPYVSVTNVLQVLDKPALRYWFGKEVYYATVKDPSLSEKEALQAPYKTSDVAKSIGTTIHSLIESYKATGKPKTDIPEEYRPYMEAFSQWTKDNQVEVIAHERTVYSDRYNYAGTADMLARINGSGIYLIDIKTGRDIYPEVELQLSAYRQGLSEGGQGVDGMAALLLEKGKDGKPTGNYKFATITDRFDEFLAAKTLWEWLNADTLKSVGYQQLTFNEQV